MDKNNNLLSSRKEIIDYVNKILDDLFENNDIYTMGLGSELKTETETSLKRISSNLEKINN